MPRYILFFICLLSLPLIAAQSNAQNHKNLSNATVSHPFFIKGDGKLTIKNVHNGKTASVTLYDEQGKLNDSAFYEIDAVFGFPSSTLGEHISQRTLFFLDHFQDEFGPDKTVMMTSGYRSPKYNQGLRNKGRGAARTSTHMDGMAIDFHFSGVNGKEMWEIIRHRDCCGIGNYGGGTIHLDSGRPRFWETATSKVKTDASAYNRFIYMSTEYDRYRAGDHIRFFYTSISNFGFGIDPKIEFIKEGEEKTIKTAKLDAKNQDKCYKIDERHQARFLYVSLPEKLKPGRYQMRVNFCDRPFEEMPTERISNVIEIVK